VLVVDGDRIQSAFSCGALQPVPADAARSTSSSPYHHAGQLAVARLADFSAVILADPAPLPAPIVDQLARYVTEGGALLIFPGPKAKPEFYLAELGVRTGLLPADLGRVRGDPTTDTNTFSLQPRAMSSVFALWNEAGAARCGSPIPRDETHPASARTNSAGA
jgi:hypothetical protein